MIKGGGYLGARTRQTIKMKLVWVRGVVCHNTQTQSLTVVACVILKAVALRRISKMTPYIRYGVRRIIAFTV